MLENTVSTPKKKIAKMVVMIRTMIAVCTVSARVGHTTLLTSARTSRMNLPGLVFAIFKFLLLYIRNKRHRSDLRVESYIGSNVGMAKALAIDSISIK